MSDNLKIRQPQDPKQVNIHETWEVTYGLKSSELLLVSLKKQLSRLALKRQT
jgi:hypothetical protein